MATQQTGIIVYRGPSMYDGSPIVVILHTGRAGNLKTTGKGKGKGKVPGLSALWIMPDTGETPKAWLERGGDAAVCSGCPHRSKASGGEGTCYTHGSVLHKGGASMLTKLWRGGYQDGTAWDAATLASALPDRPLRSAAYGDAAALPVAVWATLEGAARSRGVGFRGYTHAWRTAEHLRSTHMASADSVSDAKAARGLHWRPFRVRQTLSDVVLPGETVCPASVERGYLTTCDACTLCDGSRVGAPSVVIARHDARAQAGLRRAVASLSIGRQVAA